jgi:hypothetical protein
MSDLRLLPKPVVLLPSLAVALRLGDVIPRHWIPPRVADTGQRTGLLPGTALARCRRAVIPRHAYPPLLS